MKDKELREKVEALADKVHTAYMFSIETSNNTDSLLSRIKVLENYLNIEYQEKAPENNDYPKYVKKEKK